MKKKKFVSEVKLDRDIYQEFSSAYVMGNKKMLLVMVIGIMMIICSIILKDYKWATILGIMELFYVLLFNLALKRQKKVNYERLIEAHGGMEIHTKIVINEENIEEIDIGTGNKMNFSFAQIIGILETENLIILKLKYNIGILLDKDTLKGGTVQELVEHLKNVCCLNDKAYSKYNPKIKYFYALFGVLIVLMLGFVIYLRVSSNFFFDKVLKVLRNNGYTLELYSLEDAELVIYGVYKESDDYQFYLYNFEDEEVAKDSFNDWRNADKIGGGFEDCISEKGYYICYIKNDGFNSMILRKNKMLFYGLVDEDKRQTLDDVRNILKEVG